MQLLPNMPTLTIKEILSLNASFGGAGGGSYNTIKDPHRYAVQGSDTTMMTRAASLFGQKRSILFILFL